jgi:hypothetical protein
VELPALVVTPEQEARPARRVALVVAEIAVPAELMPVNPEMGRRMLASTLVPMGVQEQTETHLAMFGRNRRRARR